MLEEDCSRKTLTATGVGNTWVLIHRQSITLFLSPRAAAIVRTMFAYRVLSATRHVEIRRGVLARVLTLTTVQVC